MKNQILCQPTGEPVILLVDNLGVVTFKNPDNTLYTGDVNLLENCCCDVPHPPVVTNDSGSIDFTQSGTDNQTITAILTGADTATLDQFPISDGAGNIVWTSPLVTAARHDLRLVGTNLERGSDSATITNGAEFQHDNYSHLVGFSDNWIGSRGGSFPVLKLENDGKVWMGNDGSSTSWPNEATFLFDPNNEGRLYFGASFLGGNINATGRGSVNFGKAGTASGDYAFNASQNGTASGINSLNFGAFGSASGSNSINFGRDGLSSDTYSINFGEHGTASNFGSINFGSNAIASGFGSINFTADGISSGNSSINFGTSSGVASGNNSFNAAQGGIANSLSQVNLGLWPVTFTGQSGTSGVTTDILVNIGSGSSQVDRRSIFTQLKNGRTLILADNTSGSNSELQVTPKSALEVVSTTSGIIPPQLTDAAATARVLEINTTPSLTKALPGGWDDRIGETWFNLDLGTHERVIWNGTTYIKQTY